MKDLNEKVDSPFVFKISFNKLINRYEELAKSDDKFITEKAKRILDLQEQFPILREGFSDITLLETYKKEIHYILQDSFSEVLSLNEIKNNIVKRN